MNETSIPMKDWCKEDQPVYKHLLKGSYAMSNAELLCIIMGGGICTEKSLELSRSILSSADNQLGNVAKMSVGDLEQLGMKRNRAVALLAAFEIGKRRSYEQVITKEKITSSKDAFAIFSSVMSDLAYEEFWMILINKANRVLQKIKVSEGGVSGTVVDPKKIYKIALDYHAASLILGHNHPSGNISPSEADQRITKKIRDAGLLLDVCVLDHIILGNDAYYSFADEGML